jgi:hypothetical protein
MDATTNPALWTLLSGDTYTGTGPITIDTSYDASLVDEATIGADWFVQAYISRNLNLVTAPIRISITCSAVTSVTSAYNAANGNSFISELTSDGFTFAFSLEDNTASASPAVIDVPSVLTYTLDQNLCAVESYTLVTDETGNTPFTDSKYSLDSTTGALSITTSVMA